MEKIERVSIWANEGKMQRKTKTKGGRWIGRILERNRKIGER